MATSKCNTSLNIRSNSLPSRSHPSALRLEEQLNKLKTWEEAASTATADMICSSLSATEELYECLDDLLGLPLTQQALSLHQHEEWANELLDGSVRLLDICSAAREFMSQLSKHASDLQSALRRRKGDSSMESSIAKYTSFRRKMKKESKRLLAVLKRMDNKIGASSMINQDHCLEMMIRVLKEVSTRTISIFQSLLLFLSVPISKPKPAKWSMLSKLMHKGVITCEEEQENVNQLESVDAALWSLCRYGSNEGQNVQIAQNRLEALEADIQGFENALGCIVQASEKREKMLKLFLTGTVVQLNRVAERKAMAPSSKYNNGLNARLNSFPCRSHPSTLRLEGELNKLKTWEEGSFMPIADTICSSLSGMEKLYVCLDDLLGLPLTQQVLSLHQHREWINKLLDGSVRLLDICGVARDFMSQLKEHVSDLQSALRRRKGDSSMESNIAKYTCFRKKMKKDFARLIAALKQMNYTIEGSPLLDQDHHLHAVIRAIMEARQNTIAILQSLLMFLSTPVSKPKTTKWLLVSKLMHEERVTCEPQQESVNELKTADTALFILCRYGSSEREKMQIAQNRLEELEACIKGFENGLGCMFRSLIKARVSLLNVIPLI
ncbi:hypothetical protein RJ640_027849 [Escallonia rubra]|uniref:Uncharacterized protein n=1 Tax=Escallonia rubra TaxID=112253 RepID=A0AA88RW77_9ASTE|nr:hypothetical protein RJ640_027849 [Escallonia rubra]